MAGFDAHKNLAISSVLTAPTPASSGTTLVVKAGEGARFGAPPFNATVWPSSAVPTPLNAEVVRVTAVSTDTLTLARAQEGSAARLIGTGDLIAATITAKTLTDLETRVVLKDEANQFTAAPQQIGPVFNPALSFMDTVQAVDARVFRIMDSAQQLQFSALNDAQTVWQSSPLILTRQGDALVGRDVFEKARVTAVGDWINFSPSISAMPSGTVSLDSLLSMRYTLIGRTCLLGFYMLVTVGGAPTYLRILLPAGVQAAGLYYSATSYLYGTLPGMAQTAPSDIYLNLYRDATGGTPFPAGPNYAVGTAIIPIL